MGCLEAVLSKNTLRPLGVNCLLGGATVTRCNRYFVERVATVTRCIGYFVGGAPIVTRFGGDFGGREAIITSCNGDFGRVNFPKMGIVEVVFGHALHQNSSNLDVSILCHLSKDQFFFTKYSIALRFGHTFAEYGFFSVSSASSSLPRAVFIHNILEPTTGITLFNSGFKSDPTKLFLLQYWLL
jgi:hypothetical protein